MSGHNENRPHRRHPTMVECWRASFQLGHRQPHQCQKQEEESTSSYIPSRNAEQPTNNSQPVSSPSVQPQLENTVPSRSWKPSNQQYGCCWKRR